jgi:hypothetical protein
VESSCLSLKAQVLVFPLLFIPFCFFKTQSSSGVVKGAVKVEIFNACFNQKTLRNSGAARLFLLPAALDKAPEDPLQSNSESGGTGRRAGLRTPSGQIG